MEYDFDQQIDRNNTHCYKYDLREKIFGNKDIIPLWVADMDFKIADEIINNITKSAQHGIYGYTYHYDSVFQSLIDWNRKKNNFVFSRDDIHLYHGVVPSINLIIQLFSKPGDKIIIQTPVYFPFFQSIQEHNRLVLNNELVLKNNRYEMDFESLEKSIDEHTKIMILCHPHNPVGRCWTKEELIKLHDICKKHSILVISDEIHSDILLQKKTHIPWATLSDYAAQNSITLMAPSKTFNIAGLAISAIICQNKIIHSKITEFIKKNQLHGISPLNLVAFETAYTQGGIWLNQLLAYLDTNLEIVRKFADRNNKIKLIEPQATYLAWLDCRELNMTDLELRNFMIHKAGVGLSDGIQFGKGGEGFMRLNFACNKALLEKALTQIEDALATL